MMDIEPVTSAYADEIFKNHEVEYEKLEGKLVTIEWLKWKNPNSGFHSIAYVRAGGTLLVYGDMFEAVYQWNEAVTLKWISQCDIGYFHSKCRASPVGKEFKRWDYDALKTRVVDNFKDQVKDENGTDSDADERFEKFDEAGGTDYLHNEFEWYEWLSTNGDEFFGDAENWPNGWIRDDLCDLHLEGLKRAIAQLDQPKL